MEVPAQQQQTIGVSDTTSAARMTLARPTPIANVEVMSPLVTTLSGLRAKYLREMRAAREKVKQNFLK